MSSATGRMVRWVALAALCVLPSLARAQGGQVTLILSSPQPLPACDPATQGQRQPMVWDVTAQQMKTCTAHNTWSGIGAPTLFYQTVDVSGTPATQQPIINFIPGTNMTIACVNNGGATRTDCTFTATSTAATAFSALTPSTNATGGTFAATGNTWDFSGATAFNAPKVGLAFPGATSGSTLLIAAAVASGTINIPAAGGTMAVSALGPLNLSALGQVSCPACNTSTATVSSVGLTQTGSLFTITNTPITGAGNINIALASQAANLFLASPSGAPGAPSARAIVGADLPAINLAIAGAGGVVGILPKANSPVTDVYTDQSNAYTTGTQDFTLATALLVPGGAGLAPTASKSISYDTTANRYSAGMNGTNVILPWFLTGVPVAGQCAVWIGTNGQQGTSVCGGGGGGGSTNPASQFAFPYYSGAGTASTLSGVPSPTTNGLYTVAYSISGGVASAPIVSLPGISIRPNTVTPDPILQSDRVGLVTESNAGPIAVTGPALISNIPFALYNINTGLVTYTPASGQVNGAATQIVPANYFAFHYTDGTNARMPVMPTIAAFPNAPTTPLFYTAATGAFSTAILGAVGGGTGVATLAAHGLAVPEGAGTWTAVAPQADSVPLWTTGAIDPVATAINNCNSATNALTYATSTHTFGCNTITGGGGGGSGDSDFQTFTPTRYDPVGASISGAVAAVANTTTPTSLFGANVVGRKVIPAGTMIAGTSGVKTYHIRASGVIGTNSTNFVLTIIVSIGGVTVSSITAPTIASLTAVGWTLTYDFTPNTLTSTNGGGCMFITGTAGASLQGCASTANATGLDFTTDQILDVTATWTTANAANTITANELVATPDHTI